MKRAALILACVAGIVAFAAPAVAAPPAATPLQRIAPLPAATPLKGIVVTVKKKPGVFHKQATTDATSAVNFKHLAAGKYVITVPSAPRPSGKLKVRKIVVGVTISYPGRPWARRYATLAQAKHGVTVAVLAGGSMEVRLYPNAKAAQLFDASPGAVK